MTDVFSPVEIGALQIKNRFMLAPMENGLALPGGEVSGPLIDFYVKRAQRDVGILITGSVSVSPEGSGLPHPSSPSMTTAIWTVLKNFAKRCTMPAVK